jgi:hypothetical protein
MPTTYFPLFRLSSFFCLQVDLTWPFAGQGKLTDGKTIEEAAALFKENFLEKTGVDFEEHSAKAPIPGRF